MIRQERINGMQKQVSDCIAQAYERGYKDGMKEHERLEQADAQAHYLDRMRQTTKSAGYADGYIQAVKDIRGDNNG